MQIHHYIAIFFAAITFIFLIHAPTNLGIQAKHLHEQKRHIEAIIAIIGGWVITIAIFAIGYMLGCLGNM